MPAVYIVAAKRTPIGSFSGGLAGTPASKLGAVTIRDAIKQCGIVPSNIDEVIVGNVINTGQGMGPARQAAIYADIPESIPAYSINMICGSGMKSVMEASAHIRAGDAHLVVACGMENMSQAPYILGSKARTGVRLGNQVLEDTLIKDGLTDAFHQYHMGITAENIADKYKISREEQDLFALNSQNKAIKALSSGQFKEEISPITITTRSGDTLFEQDEYPKADSSLEKLSKLRPAFKDDGSVTAGNASGLNDGAAAIILASEEAVKKYNLTPMAEIVAYSQTGTDPKLMGLGPVSAIKKALDNASHSLDEMQSIELNEAFAAQALGVIKELSTQHKIPEHSLEALCNPNGGAIALGHPLGASGTRILVTLLYHLRSSKKELGLASLCIGGGMGTAMIIKNLKRQ